MKITLDAHLSDAQIKKILENITIIVDSREKKNEHIIDYFLEHGINWEKKALSCGDYSVILNIDIEGFPKEVDLRNEVVVERKNSLEELSSNFTSGRTNFENEFSLGFDKGTQMFLLIENEESIFNNIKNNKYNSSYNSNSFMASLITFMHRYKINILNSSKELTGELIYKTLYYYTREILKE